MSAWKVRFHANIRASWALVAVLRWVNLTIFPFVKRFANGLTTWSEGKPCYPEIVGCAEVTLDIILNYLLQRLSVSSQRRLFLDFAVQFLFEHWNLTLFLTPYFAFPHNVLQIGKLKGRSSLGFFFFFFDEEMRGSRKCQGYIQSINQCLFHQVFTIKFVHLEAILIGSLRLVFFVFAFRLKLGGFNQGQTFRDPSGKEVSLAKQLCLHNWKRNAVHATQPNPTLPPLSYLCICWIVY